MTLLKILFSFNAMDQKKIFKEMSDFKKIIQISKRFLYIQFIFLGIY